MPCPSLSKRLLVALCVLLAADLRAKADATIEGKVPVPEGRSTPVLNKRYEIVSKGGILATTPPLAVIYLEGRFAYPAKPPQASVIQRDMAFVPAILPVQVGTVVSFPNEDEMYHNIFSYSPTKRFDLGRYRSDERPIPSVTFDKAGLVVLHCDIHEHMRGLVLVVPTPYFVTSDPLGHYRLAGLPPGHYVLKAWIDSRTTLEKPVDLVDGGQLTVDFQ